MPLQGSGGCKMVWKHFSGDKQWKWSSIKNNPKGKKIWNHFETKEGWSKKPFWKDLYSVLCCLQNPEMPGKVVSDLCKPYTYSCYVRALNITEIGDPVTKFTAVSFEVIYLFAIVSESALTWKEEVLMQKIF